MDDTLEINKIERIGICVVETKRGLSGFPGDDAANATGVG